MLGAPPRRVVGLFGDLKAKKRIPFWLEAVRASPPPAAAEMSLLVVGNLDEETTQLLDDPALGPRSVRMPFCAPSELAALYSACDYVAIPSGFDGMPNVLLEAMACGVVPIRFRCGRARRGDRGGRHWLCIPRRESRCRRGRHGRRLALDDTACRDVRARAPQRIREIHGRAEVDVSVSCCNCRRNERVLYFAPGSGLGHLNRALAVCLALRDRGVEAEIITNSPFAEGLARAARRTITRIPTAQWKQAAPEYARSRTPRLMIVDTFPFGLRGEWEHAAARRPRRLPRAAAANGELPGIRRLEALRWDQRPPRHCRPITSKPSRMLTSAWCDCPVSSVSSPAPFPRPVPQLLGKLLDSGKGRLVVHSGPPEEVRRLVHLARSKMPPDAELALIAPWRADGADCPCFEYYPAGNLTVRAAHVVSGAGYSAVADMLFHRERHTTIAFERRFDDQAERLAALPAHAVDGTASPPTQSRDML